MKSSARNQFFGPIQEISIENSIGIITVASGEHLIKIQLNKSRIEELNLVVGLMVVVMVKASELMLISNHEQLFKLSAENQLSGVVSHIEFGAVNHVVTLSIDKDTHVSATITVGSGERLDIRIGQNLTALFRADSAILGILI